MKQPREKGEKQRDHQHMRMVIVIDDDDDKQMQGCVTGDVDQLVEHLSGIHEALGLIPRTI